MITTDLMAVYQHTCAILDEKAGEIFQKFQAYIQCKNGCSSCCEKAQFRIRLIEAQALLGAFHQATPETQQAIRNNLFSPETGHEHDCPILVEGSCALYSDRPALCRAYGALIRLKKGVSTCKLNFKEVPEDLQLEVLEIEPFYDVLDELSSQLWQQSPNADNPTPPTHTIREFFNRLLQLIN